MWHERVNCQLGGSNPTFLAAEGSSAHPRILWASCRSASGGNENLGASSDGIPDALYIQLFVCHFPLLYIQMHDKPHL